MGRTSASRTIAEESTMRSPLLSASFLLALLLAGLGVSPIAEARGYRCGQCGTVEDVDRIWYEGRRDSGREGAVLGAIIGGALGNQVGRGDGRKAATIAGAVVGGLVGRDIDRNDGRGGRRGEEGLRLRIRMDRGFNQTVEIHGDMRIYRGDRVRLRGGRVELIR
jgi:outer membrane lipoprotein SlyB